MIAGLSVEGLLAASCKHSGRCSQPLPAQFLHSRPQNRGVNGGQSGACSRLKGTASAAVQEQEFVTGKGQHVVVANTEKGTYNVVFVSSEVRLDGTLRMF